MYGLDIFVYSMLVAFFIAGVALATLIARESSKMLENMHKMEREEQENDRKFGHA